MEHARSHFTTTQNTLATTQQQIKNAQNILATTVHTNVKFCGFKIVFDYLFIFIIIAIIVASHVGDVAIVITATFSDIFTLNNHIPNINYL